MDPADAFVNLYDELRHVTADELSEWSVTPLVKDLAERVCADVTRSGSLHPQWNPANMYDPRSRFGVLLGLDLALLNANGDMNHLGTDALDELQVRLAMNGRLNEHTSGLLLFRRASWSRPNKDREDLDGFLHLLRIPADLSSDLGVHAVPEAYDLPDTEDLRDPGELEPPPPIVIAQLPLLATPSDLRWDLVDNAQGAFYTVAPESGRLVPHLREALSALDDSGAAVAFLPEGALDEDIFTAWCDLLENIPRPEDGKLTWLLLGTGPVTSVGPPTNTDRDPNRAVLVHRSGRDRLLLTQDKRSGFCFTTDKQKEYEVPLGEVNRDEYISHPHQVNLLESRCGRFAVQICEDLDRPDRLRHVMAAGVTHLLVPVLAAAMWTEGWQVKAGQTAAINAGTKVAVGNGLAIHRFYAGDPVPTLLTVTGPPGGVDQYLTGQQMIAAYPNTDSKDMDAREDALLPRVAEW
jgi:predicted amidohydrolase